MKQHTAIIGDDVDQSTLLRVPRRKTKVEKLAIAIFSVFAEPCKAWWKETFGPKPLIPSWMRWMGTAIVAIYILHWIIDKFYH